MRTLTILLLAFIFGSIGVNAQTLKIDSLEYLLYDDKSGTQKRAIIAHPKQILIVEGDSIYTVTSELVLREILKKSQGYDIINNPDSINNFVRSRIKGIVIVKKKPQ